jgi:hypothetical protein
MNWRATLLRVPGVCGALAVCSFGTAELALGTPHLYSAPAHESPVRADPDDLLLLPGYGLAASDRVVYSVLRDTAAALLPPRLADIPLEQTRAAGFADVVSVADTPYSLTVRLPEATSRGRAYALWVINAAGEWSNGVRINDARPLWITPDYAYATASLANLPRVLKVVGRNLQPVANAPTRVRLVGPHTYTLPASNRSASLSRYVAEVTLPSFIVPGRYAVQTSRDGSTWSPIMNVAGGRAQTFRVLPDPVAGAAVEVRDFNCDATDDTSCIVRAIAAAANVTKYPHGATVVFDRRTYQLSDPGTWSAGANVSSKGVDVEGIWVPRHVSLRGAGATVVVRGSGWLAETSAPDDRRVPIASLFNLQGDNTVEGFTFDDENVYTASSAGRNAALSLGIDANYAHSIGLSQPVSHVVISHNEFRHPFVAIQNGGLPLDHLYITYNDFGAWQNGLYLGRQGNLGTANPFDLTDSVISYNTFHPGSFPATIASQLGGGTRLDFSNNVADGTSTAYLYDAADPRGFRAAFFWHLGTNSELKLISQNRILCSGDKPGDGEAIVFDGADETDYGGYVRAAPVVASSSKDWSSEVAVGASPLRGPLGFVGQWLQVVRGPGRGQLRKVTAFSATSSAATFTVSPPFDVLPGPGSAVTVGLENWQSYVVDNHVDHGARLCVNGPKSNPSGGGIIFYAQTADSVIEGNRQNASSGILLAHQYILSPSRPAFLMLQAANEIRDNLVEQAPMFAGLRGVSGIRSAYVATAENRGEPPPPVLDFATSIAGNRLVAADGPGGAIEFQDGGPVGWRNSTDGCVATWEIAAAPLVFHNDVSASPGTGIGIGSRAPPQRPARCPPGIRDPIVWHATLYANSCAGVSRPLSDDGTGTQRICRAQNGTLCECAQSPTTVGPN